MKVNTYSTLSIMFVMLASTLIVSYIMLVFVRYEPLPSDIIQTTPKYHYTPVRIREA